MAANSSNESRLCYLKAEHIEGPLDGFAQLKDAQILSDDHRKLGTLDGIILEPAERRLRYLVVDAGGVLRKRRYLLPLAETHVDADRQALCVELDKAELSRCKEFDPSLYATFSDDDLLTALFVRNVPINS